MSYGVFQEFYSENWTFHGNKELTGIFGTTSNGVMYLSMPFLFALFTKRWARYRQVVAVCGALIACVSFVLSAFAHRYGSLSQLRESWLLSGVLSCTVRSRSHSENGSTIVTELSLTASPSLSRTSLTLSVPSCSEAYSIVMDLR